MGQETLSRREFLETSAKWLGGVVVAGATIDGWNSMLNPPKGSLYEERVSLYSQQQALTTKINSSRDVQANALIREQIEINKRDISEIYEKILDQEGPVLSRSRILGILLGTPLLMVTGLRYLGNGLDFVLKKRSSLLQTSDSQ